MRCHTTYEPGVHLCVEDIAVDDPLSPAVLQVTIKQSKTDPFRKGVSVNRSDRNKVVPGGCNVRLSCSERCVSRPSVQV